MTSHVDSHGRPRVVVTGMGVKTPAGVDVDSLWERICAGRGTAKRIERFDPSELPVQFDARRQFKKSAGAHCVPAGYRWHPPAPSQEPSVAQVAAP